MLCNALLQPQLTTGNGWSSLSVIILYILHPFMIQFIKLIHFFGTGRIDCFYVENAHFLLSEKT